MTYVYGRNLHLDSINLDDFEIIFETPGTKEVFTEPLSVDGKGLHITVANSEVNLILRPKQSIILKVGDHYNFSVRVKTNISDEYELLTISHKISEDSINDFETIFIFNGEGLTDVYLYDFQLVYRDVEVPWSVPPEEIFIIQNNRAFQSVNYPTSGNWITEQKIEYTSYGRVTETDVNLTNDESYVSIPGIPGERIVQFERMHLNNLPTDVTRNEVVISETESVPETYIQGTKSIEWKLEIENVTVPFIRLITDDNQLLAENSYIQKPGINGNQEYQHEVLYINGVRQVKTRYRTLVSEVQPVPEIYIRGTMSVSWVTETRTTTELFGSTYTNDPTLDPRDSYLESEGINGTTVYEYQRQFVNGVSTNEIRNEVIKSKTPPINRVFIKGTKELLEVTLTNMLLNGDFESGSFNWSTQNAVLTNEEKGIKFVANSRNQQFYRSVPTIPGHKYYVTAKVRSNGQVGIAIDRLNTYSTNNAINKFVSISTTFTATDYFTDIGMIELNSRVGTHFIDHIMMYDLTIAFGLENEPGKKFVDYVVLNRHYFSQRTLSIVDAPSILTEFQVPFDTVFGIRYFYRWIDGPPKADKFYDLETDYLTGVVAVSETGGIASASDRVLEGKNILGENFFRENHFAGLTFNGNTQGVKFPNFIRLYESDWVRPRYNE